MSVRNACGALAICAMLTIAAGCGGDDQQSERSGLELPSAAGAVTEQTDDTDGGAVDDGPGQSNVGDRDERDRLLAVFAKMQRDYRAGRMHAVCRHVSRDMLAQFPLGEEEQGGSCSERLARYARLRERRGARRPTFTLVWVRIYDNLDIGGITVVRSVEDPLDKRVRIPFIREDGRWKLELGVFTRPDMLDGRMILSL